MPEPSEQSEKPEQLQERIISLKKEIKSFENQLQLLKEERERTIDQYRDKYAAIDEKFLAKQKDVEQVEASFKEEYAKRLERLEADEKKIKQSFMMVDEHARVQDKDKLDFDEEKSAFYKNQEVLKAETQELIRQNQVLLDQAREYKLQAAATLEENKAVLSQTQVNENYFKQKKEELKAIEDEASKKFFDAEQRLSLAEQKEQSAENKIAELNEKQSSISFLIDDAQKKKDESIEARRIAVEEKVSLEAKKVEVQAIIKESNDKISQIMAESDKNNTERIANRAKEIQLNEKERSLNERDKNLKILEQSKG